MRVHIVNPYNSVAMQRMTVPLQELARLHDVSIGPEIEPAAAVNIHVPLHTLAGERDYGAGKHIAVYTHCNPGAERELYEACERADIVTAMSFEGRRELLNYGVDPKKIWVVPAAADNFPYRKRMILVVGYPQPNGRKRESLLVDLAWTYDLSLYEFLLIGPQWEQTAEVLASLGVSVKFANADNEDLLRRFYQAADVFLATGYREGGPLPLLEAMASGTRVLSPKFGYAADLLNADDLYETPAELMGKLNDMFAERVFYHQLARAWTWRDYAAEYAMLIGRLMGESVDLYPERGISRYVQLLDVIDEVKPCSICEIGTWNGNRAIQMLQAAGKYHQSERLFYQGFDLFETQTGEQFRRELSKVGHPQSVVERRLSATRAHIDLIVGDTKNTIEQLAEAEFYFVDGGHSEETIANDAEVVLSGLIGGDVAVFDDYYHEGKPDGVGCNKFIDGLDREKYQVTFLPALTTANDGRVIGMVRVERRKENNADVHVQVPTKSYAGIDSLNSGLWGTTPLPPMQYSNAQIAASFSSELERTTPASGTPEKPGD